MNIERFIAFTNQYRQKPGQSDFQATPTAVGHLIYSIAKLEQPKRMVEVGSHEGATSAWMIRALKENGAGTYEGWEVNESVTRKWKSSLTDIFGKVNAATLHESSFLEETNVHTDFAFIDLEPKKDYVAAFERMNVSVDGIVMAHDLTWKGRPPWEPNDYNQGVWDLYDTFLSLDEWDVVPFFGGRGLIVARKRG